MTRGTRYGSDPYAPPNTRYSHWSPVLGHKRGLQPPPQDVRKLYKECTRLAWAIRCALGPRQKLAIVLDRYDTKLAALRRQHDLCTAALEALDPELFARAEQHRRDLDDPLKVLAFEQGHGGDGDAF